MPETICDMTDFSRIILVEPSFSPEFFFQKFISPKSEKYHVFTKDKQHNDCSFEMERAYGRWKIIDAPKVPQWIISLEAQLEEVINLAENTIN